MSRRKQTKPFKVEDKIEPRKEKKPKLRRILPRAHILARQPPAQIDSNRANLSDRDAVYGSEGRHSKRGTKCNQCGKVLASSLSLARHKLTHSENKPFQCPQCGAGFKTSSNMHRHLRIHFREKEQSDTELAATKQPRLSSQRSPRQNIRTPNKFKEFDVDLVGIGPRGPSDSPVTNARSYSKPKDSLFPRKHSMKGKSESAVEESESEYRAITEHTDNGEELPDLNSPRRRGLSVSWKAESARRLEDLLCHVCNKTFISRYGLLTHSMSHSEPESSTKCHFCDQSFTTPRGLMVHNVIVHKIEGCQAENKTKRGFRDIALLDFSATKFPVVAEVACTKSQRSRPLRDTWHIFICKKCDKAFPLLAALKLHMNKTHWNKEKPVLPQDASVTWLTYLNLCPQIEKAEDSSELEEPTSRIGADVDDDFIFTSKSVALEDIPPWLQQLPDISLSDYQKENSTGLIFQIETEVTPSQLQIEIPGRTAVFPAASSSAEMDTRSLSHNRRRTRNQVDNGSILRRFDNTLRHADGDKSSGERNVFWCRICNYSSHEKSALVRHLLTHSGIRPYFCKICDYAFTTKANCERHVRKRHNCTDRVDLDAAVRCDWEMLKKAPRDDIYMISGSNSICPVCNKSFPCNNDLKQHLKIHEERQFVCHLCNVRCTTRNNCVRHVLHKHPGIPYQEANNIITFDGTRNKDLNMNNLPDMMKDKSEIDISKGRLGGRRSTDTNQSWPNSRLKQPRTHHNEQLPAKKRRLSPGENTSQPTSTPDDQDNSVPVSLSEGSTCGEETRNRPLTLLPLIPLLKIKAYSEAAARSYADMVALYQHLNFLNTERDIGTVDDTIMAMVESPVKDREDAFTREETMFICRSCSKSFETENGLNNHIISCKEKTSDRPFYPSLGSLFDRDRTGDGDYNWARNDDIFPESASGSAKGEADRGSCTDNDWNIANTAESLHSPLHVKVFESGENVKQWVNDSSANSPYSVKSGGDCESSFEQSGTRISLSHCKDSSYVEDSLLMSMFADDRRNKEFDDGGRIYASSFPTMVNMESPTMTRIKYQNSGHLNSSSESMDDKKKLSEKGKMYAARRCPQCDKTFPWASSLRRHIMTHTGLKLYMCRLCKMRFTTRSNLIRHVYRRHGMAKQHPEFASCLAKLHPSDTLLREVEADVRRRIDLVKTRIPTLPADSDDVSDGGDVEYLEESVNAKKKDLPSDFQSMLEEDPETMLVDLDYSPRDEMSSADDKKQISEFARKMTSSQDLDPPRKIPPTSPKKCEGADIVVKKSDSFLISAKELSEDDGVKAEKELVQEAPRRVKGLRRRSDNKTFVGPKQATATKSTTPQKVGENPTLEGGARAKSRSSKQSSQFVCGLCKKIFKTVPDLISHLDTHNVPHSWHCPVCGVPFTNKYNCQRHLTRRHNRADVEPLYVEDSKHGPRTARGHPRKTAVYGEDGNES